MTSSLHDGNAGGGDYPPLSALNQLSFCARRCAMMLLENIWVESTHTVQGTVFHQRVHAKGNRYREEKMELRGIRILSHSLKIQGVADMVELHESPNGYVPYPVEYKRGKVKSWDNDDVQVCAQAICLEEMFGKAVPKGAIYHIMSKSRREVIFTDALRDKTVQAARDLHHLLGQKELPAPIPLPHCQKCSLKHRCLPRLTSLDKAYQKAMAELFCP